MARKIVCTPGYVGGAPRIDGTRMYCSAVVLYVAGCGLNGFQKDYPDIPLDDVKECVRYCASQKCLDDRPVNYCCDCTHDTRFGDEWQDAFGEKPTDVWRTAAFIDETIVSDSPI